MTTSNKNLGKILRQRRVTMLLTLGDLSAKSGVSPSHLARIEKGERFPSAQVLRRIAKPLRFSEGELFAFAGYLPSQPLSTADSFSGGQLDPYVATVLSREPVETQRTVVTILSVLKSMAQGIVRENSRKDTSGGANISAENLG
ncbi:MAG: helix-turn-helix domain-containing protein [Dehalococcoidales bacterium]